MYKFKKSLIALTGVISLVAIATVITPHLSYGSGPTAAAPTSQTQNVNVVNTPTVNAQQSGNWSVGINGTPVVKIDNSDPLVVRDGDNPARRPIEAATAVIIQNGEDGGIRTITTVPMGKTLVVEYISVDGRLTNERLVSTRVSSVLDGDVGKSHYLTLTDQGTDFFGREVFTASQLVRLYFPEGAAVIIEAERNGHAGQTSISVSLSGYLVNN